MKILGKTWDSIETMIALSDCPSFKNRSFLVQRVWEPDNAILTKLSFICVYPEINLTLHKNLNCPSGEIQFALA